jgi:hypothetical protein
MSACDLRPLGGRTGNAGWRGDLVGSHEKMFENQLTALKKGPGNQ